jgi:hypothetical protein
MLIKIQISDRQTSFICLNFPNAEIVIPWALQDGGEYSVGMIWLAHSLSRGNNHIILDSESI